MLFKFIITYSMMQCWKLYFYSNKNKPSSVIPFHDKFNRRKIPLSTKKKGWNAKKLYFFLIIKKYCKEIPLLHIVTYLKMQEDRDGNKNEKQGKMRFSFFCCYSCFLLLKKEVRKKHQLRLTLSQSIQEAFRCHRNKIH